MYTELESSGADMSSLKSRLVEVLVHHICPIGDEIKRLEQDPSHLDSILKAGAERASSVAEATMVDVRRAMGVN